MIPKNVVAFTLAILAALAATQVQADMMLGSGSHAGGGAFYFAMGARTSMRGLNSSSPHPVMPPRSKLVASSPNGLEVEQLGNRLRIRVPWNVLFDFDRHELRPNAAVALQSVANLARARRTTDIQLHGHTDAVGSAQYNQRLSQRRADAVKRWLITQGGFPLSSVHAQGHGENQPIAPNSYPNGDDNPHGRALNRRVEFVI